MLWLGYWAFLDFALAFIPIDMVWKLQMTRQKKFWLSCLLGMGVLYVCFPRYGFDFADLVQRWSSSRGKDVKSPYNSQSSRLRHNL